MFDWVHIRLWLALILIKKNIYVKDDLIHFTKLLFWEPISCCIFHAGGICLKKIMIFCERLYFEDVCTYTCVDLLNLMFSLLYAKIANLSFLESDISKAD